MRVTIVGLGPGPADWLTTAGAQRLHAPGARVFARTRLHPALTSLAGLEFESFDALYVTATSLDEVHRQIAARLLNSGADAVLAVPGDGTLAEAVLDNLRAGGADIEIVPGVPLGVGALAAAGMAANDGAQFLEATALGGSSVELKIELNPRWPAVITGIFSSQVAGDTKLSLLRVYPAEHRGSLVRHAGLADQQAHVLAIADLDRASLEFDHLTHLVLPPVPVAHPTGSTEALRAIVARLRAPEIGCPWDLQQTHASLIPYVIEEAYEVVDAIEDGDVGELADELGDVLLQVALHAEIADQSGEFEWNDVVRALSAKLVRRHPHVFGEVEVEGVPDVLRNWAAIKAQERGADAATSNSAIDGISRSLPALKSAAELARKASRAGFDWPTRDGTLDKVREELAELLAATSLAERREELGDLLYVLAKLAGQDGIDAEDALRAANRKFAMRFKVLEAIARERGWASLQEQPLAELEAAWGEAKQRVGAANTDLR